MVVGAGIAGSALAYKLGQARGGWRTGAHHKARHKLTPLLPPACAQEGRRVLLLERDLVQPDRIVGELLQPGGYLKLKELGLQDCLDDIDAQLVHGYVLFKQGEQAQLNYPTESHGPDVAGRSFHNGRFVQRLRHRAAAAPGVSL